MRLIVGACALGTGVMFGSAAWADASVQSTAPADGAVLDKPPAAVTIMFDDSLQARFTRVSVTGSNGQKIAVPPAATSNVVVSQAIPADLPPGTYTASYRVVSADGHPVAGTLSFTVATRLYPSTAPSIGQVPPKQAAQASSQSPLLWTLVAGGVAITILLGVVVMSRRRRRPA